ncbi:hypothetical protein DCC81_03595 [Chitinophaga parva]|uniref:Uncharacterized protein n=1 Tax=Chitinophaga parva TaxID=2169414 RepID=A0A2T7BLL9_9BACT|nr:hypothetical protein [Chitinophaga parva]PUZ28577.1 hypothetical protein DCC81_03595 [Chitinophaga parva]
MLQRSLQMPITSTHFDLLMISDMEPNANYILELHTYRDNENVPIERRYFDTIHEAMISLLGIPLNRYLSPDLSLGEPELSRVLVLEKTPGSEYQIASTFILPIEDVLNDGPSAGLYLHHNDDRGAEDSIGSLENRIGASFYQFRHYDHDMPMVQLARLVYDDSQKIIADHALEPMIEQLQNSVQVPWQYELRILDTDAAISVHRFHHAGMPAAFDQLIGLKYFDSAASDPKYRWETETPDLMISERSGVPIVTVSVDSKTSEDHRPVSLLVIGGLARLEAIAGVNLSTFAGYGHDGFELPIGSIRGTDHVFTPVPAFAALQDPKSLQQVQLPENAPFTLSLEYRELKSLEQKDAVTAATFKTYTFADLKDAVAALRKIDLESFDVTHAVKWSKKEYLHQATLYHSTERYEVASMFSVLRDQPHVPAGTYLKINPDHLSTDTLHVLHPFVKDLPHQGALLFMAKSAAAQAQELRRTVGPRHFSEGGSRRI